MLGGDWRPHLVVSTAPYDGHPTHVALESLATYDEISIELAYIDGYVEHFSEELFTDRHAQETIVALSETGTTCYAVSAHTDLAGDAGLDRGLRRIRFAGSIGASCVVSNAARIAGADSFRANLEAFAREAERSRVELLLENPGDGKRNVVDDGRTAAALAREWTGTPIGINYDFGNVISHFDESVQPEEDFQPLRTLARYLHLKDVVREGDAWRYPSIGTGMIDYRRVLSEVRQDAHLPAVGIELPLRLRRTRDVPNARIPDRMPLSAITGAITESLAFVRRYLS